MTALTLESRTAAKSAPGQPLAPAVDRIVGQVRSERQTLVRLPRTGAVLFTIKTQLCPVTALRQRQDLAGALACYEKALAIQPRFAEALYNLGNVFIELGRLPEATDALKKAIAVLKLANREKLPVFPRGAGSGFTQGAGATLAATGGQSISIDTAAASALPGGTAPRTIELWVQPASTGDWLVHYGDHFGVRLDAPGSLSVITGPAAT